MTTTISRAISYSGGGAGAAAMSMWMSISRRMVSTRAAKNASKEDREASVLYRRLSALGGRRDVDVRDIMNEWEKEGRPIEKKHVIGFVYQLRKYKKYDHAIQLFKWLSSKGQDLSYSEQAVRLDLIAKAKGIEAAEKRFMNLPEFLQNKLTYGALLNCYCKEKMTEKAMNLLEKMKELNFASTSLVYNNIIGLHMKIGEPEKVPPLVQEMKEKSITPDVYTYSFLMNSYALLKDIEGAEGVIEQMKKDGVKSDWSVYANLASIYVKAGDFVKANSTLQNIEKRKDLRDRKAYYILVGLYSHTSNKLGVERVWDSLKLAFPKLTNSCYLSKLQALQRLGDTDSLKKCYEEWESTGSNYDIRLTNVIIDSYLSQGMVEEAESLRETALRKGCKPSFKTLEMFINFYLLKCQVDLALKHLETAASKFRYTEWKPSEDAVSTFLKYFEAKKDVHGAENLFRNLKKLKCIDSKVYESIMRTYVAAGKREPEMQKRLKEDGIEMSTILNELIKKVCP